jgi:hypothetical protein
MAGSLVDQVAGRKFTKADIGRAGDRFPCPTPTGIHGATEPSRLEGAGGGLCQRYSRLLSM